MNRKQELEQIEKWIRNKGITLCQSDPRLNKEMSSNPENCKVNRKLLVKNRKEGDDEQESLVWIESKRHPQYDDFFDEDSHGGVEKPRTIHTSNSPWQKWMQGN